MPSDTPYGARLFLAAWEASSPRAISELFADDGVFINPLQPQPLVGPGQIFDAVSIGLGKIEDVTIRVTSAIEHAATACIEGEFLSRKRADGARFEGTVYMDRKRGDEGDEEESL